jgi:hypothetical protein
MWHAVQQKQGRVKPTGSIKGNKVNRSAALEKEADVMGAKALSSPSRSASKGVATGKVVQKKDNDKKDQGKNDKQKELRKSFDDWFGVWKKTQNASKIELDKLTEKLKKEDPIGFGDKFNRYNSGITNALGEEYERVSGNYYLSLSLTGLGLEVLRWIEDQGSLGKLPTYDEINKRAFDMLKEDERFKTYVAPILYTVIGIGGLKPSNLTKTKASKVELKEEGVHGKNNANAAPKELKTKASVGKLDKLQRAATTKVRDLDWSIVNKSGESRFEHVMKHGSNNLQKDSHGVFYGDPIKTVNSAWLIKGNIKPITQGGTDMYIIPYKNAGYTGGFSGQGTNLNNITIITKTGSNQIITAFPSGSGMPVKH